jgi:hypothetical protein
MDFAGIKRELRKWERKITDLAFFSYSTPFSGLFSFYCYHFATTTPRESSRGVPMASLFAPRYQ